MNIPVHLGIIVSRKLATLHELQTIYDLEDVYDMIEIIAVDNANERELGKG